MGTESLLPDQVRTGAVLVAHPDDETLWAGGLLMLTPRCRWLVVALCRAGDPDRAPKFRRVVRALGARGRMADLDDGPEQSPLPSALIERTALELLGGACFDLVLTHGPRGEYTSHRRHEELSRAAAAAWRDGRLKAGALWMFAYEDGGGLYLPRPDPTAHRAIRLPEDVWRRKRELVTGLYGFGPDSFEARATPPTEAFWCFGSPRDLDRRLPAGATHP
jgi:LmbE family N-acetylglucosaminyl deacetylase